MSCFKTRGKKSQPHGDPNDPPRRRANKRRGHGTYEADRPPIVGTIGRVSGQVRLRVEHRTDQATLEPHVHHCTQPRAVVNTDNWKAYAGVQRVHHPVCHRAGEWARDDDGDGIREVHTNTIEGLWTTVRNFLRPFRGVHQKNLAGHVAICELAINHGGISPQVVGILARIHDF